MRFRPPLGDCRWGTDHSGHHRPSHSRRYPAYSTRGGVKRTLLETVRIIDGRAPLWSLHMARLSRSCTALQVTRPELIEPRGGPDRVIRFEVQTAGVRTLERPVGSLDPIHLASSPAPHRGYRHKTADRAWLQAARSSASLLSGRRTRVRPLDGAGAKSSRGRSGRSAGGRESPSISRPCPSGGSPASLAFGSAKSPAAGSGSSRTPPRPRRAAAIGCNRRAASCRWQCSTARAVT